MFKTTENEEKKTVGRGQRAVNSQIQQSVIKYNIRKQYQKINKKL